jgi:predicted transcriptional regulator of viral defense system
MKSMDDRRQKLYTVAESQGGYFSAKQALSCGYSHRLQHYHKGKGHWVEIERGCFRLMNYPSSPNEDFIRWSFWSRNRGDIAQAAVSHESALAFHELGDVVPSKIHLTVPPTFRKKAAGGCVLHRKACKALSTPPRATPALSSLSRPCGTLFKKDFWSRRPLQKLK